MTSRFIPQKFISFSQRAGKPQGLNRRVRPGGRGRPNRDRGYWSSPDWLPGEPDFFPRLVRARHRAANSGSSPSVPGA